MLEELPIELRPVPYRYKNALSWRVASDLCRRDSGLVVTFPEGGSSAFANSLMIGKGQELSYEMRRMGGGVVSHARGLNMLSWEKAFSFANPRELVKELEKLERYASRRRRPLYLEPWVTGSSLLFSTCCSWIRGNGTGIPGRPVHWRDKARAPQLASRTGSGGLLRTLAGICAAMRRIWRKLTLTGGSGQGAIRSAAGALRRAGSEGGEGSQ